jgi:uncharacterized membrane protein YphA (DoxX/SURF4 family)
LVGTVLRVLLGGVLLVAGALKVTNLPASALAVHAYRLLPYEVGQAIGYALPILELAIGALLLIGLFTRAAAVVGALLMGAFVVGIASAWARGLSIDCGCFGGGGQIGAEQTAYPLELTRDAALLLAAVWLTRRPDTAYALDARG